MRMERKSEHLVEDQQLRRPFIDQMSWDEWAAVHTPFFLHPDARDLIEDAMRLQGIEAEYEDALAVAENEWLATLDRRTNYAEVLYLRGHNYSQRLHIIDQTHKELLSAFVEKGMIPERDSDIEFREQFGD